MRNQTIIIILILLVISSGCTFSLSDLKDKLPFMPKDIDLIKDKSKFLEGTEGITAEIIRPAEGGKAYTTVPFKVEVKVKNEGEFGDEREPADGITCLSGLNKNYFPGIVLEYQDFSLKGKKLVNNEEIEGDEEILVFEGGDIESGSLTEFIITAKTRYNYKTYGVINACIKKDANSKEGCTIKSDMLMSSSSAPLAIEKVTQVIVPETDESIEIRFQIHLKEEGDGELYELDRDQSDCGTLTDVKKLVKVSMVNAPGTVTCKDTQLVKQSTGSLLSQDKGKAIADCKVTNVKLSGKGYESEMTVILEYAYETIDSNKFEVSS